MLPWFQVKGTQGMEEWYNCTIEIVQFHKAHDTFPLWFHRTQLRMPSA